MDHLLEPKKKVAIIERWPNVVERWTLVDVQNQCS